MIRIAYTFKNSEEQLAHEVIERSKWKFIVKQFDAHLLNMANENALTDSERAIYSKLKEQLNKYIRNDGLKL